MQETKIATSPVSNLRTVIQNAKHFVSPADIDKSLTT